MRERFDTLARKARLEEKQMEADELRLRQQDPEFWDDADNAAKQSQKLKSLEKFLEGAARSLKPGGRLVVITYHSLEDRMVKNFIKTGNVEGTLRQDVFGRADTPLEAVNRKPILPAEEEISQNTRARSAKLRIAERKAEPKDSSRSAERPAERRGIIGGSAPSKKNEGGPAR